MSDPRDEVPDPAEELRQLAGGLSSELTRARRRGRRALRPTAGPPPASEDPPPAPAATAAAAAAAPGSSPQEGPPRTVPPSRPSAPSPDSATKSGSTAPSPLDRETPDETIRRLAAAAPDLETLRERVSACEACDLCRTRTNTVFSDGSSTARVMFVGEAPGFHEDQQGVPFVGDAGHMLTDIITKGMKLARADVYIANVLKCRPPDNRDPAPLEKALCTGWLERQIELVDPEVLIPLGRHAAGHVLGRDESMGRMRARVHTVGGRKIVPTYHPAYLLRTPSAKRACWEDIQLAMAELGLG